MPTYEYSCNNCGEFEFVQKISEDALKECPKCNGKEVVRLLSGGAFHLKGSGWYKTDYSSGSSSSSSSSASSSSAGSSSVSSNAVNTASSASTASESATSSSSAPSSSTAPSAGGCGGSCSCH